MFLSFLCVGMLMNGIFLVIRDVVLYALGVGACARDALDVDELKYVYNEGGQQFVQVLLIYPLLK
jgi:hypothetical protein